MYNALTRIDASMLSDHWHLDSDDYCTFMGEYTARKGWDFSPSNQLISNYKKSPLKRNTNQWAHKERAIRTVATSLVTCLSSYADDITLVPVPPSKSKDHAEYDDRLIKTLELCKQSLPGIDYRELVSQSVSTEASHESTYRRKPHELVELYDLDESLVNGTRKTIIIFDDMITAGSHFKAMKSVLTDEFPDHDIVGLFVTRRVPETDDLSIFDDIYT